MPHITLRGAIDLEAYWRGYRPLLERDPTGDVRKTFECWLSDRRSSLLIDALCLERGVSRRFFVLVSAKETPSVTVGLDASTRPPSPVPDSVKTLIAMVAEALHAAFPHLAYATTNLPEFVRHAPLPPTSLGPAANSGMGP